MNTYWRLLFTQQFLLSNYVSWRVPLQFKPIILTTKKVNWCFLQYIFLYLKFCDVRKNFVNLHARFPSTLKHFYSLPLSHFILCFLVGLACTDTFLLNLQPDFHIHLSVICSFSLPYTPCQSHWLPDMLFFFKEFAFYCFSLFFTHCCSAAIYISQFIPCLSFIVSE